MTAAFAIPASDRAVSRSDNAPPPSAVERASDTTGRLNAFLADHPIIQTSEEARKAIDLIRQGKAALDEIETERRGRIAPHSEAIDAIRSEYRAPETVLSRVRKTLMDRKDAFAAAEEALRVAAAEEARRVAIEAERVAREAEAREREAQDEAAAGVVGIDVATVTAEADTAFAHAGRAIRDAARAGRATDIRLGLRRVETLTVTDPAAALAALGLTDDIAAAIVKGARAFRKIRGVLPPGVTASLS